MADSAAPPPNESERSVLGLFSHDYAADFFGKIPRSEWRYLRHAKIELRWERVELKKGSYDWSGIDAQVKALQANGIDDLLLLINVPVPTWARDSSYGKQAYRAPPVDPDGWRRFVEAVVQRYESVAGYYEILNEPGWDRDSAAFEKYGSYHFGGQVETDYLPMLETAYGIVKDLDPTAVVISGAMNCDVSGVPDNGLWLMDLMTDDGHRMQDYCDAFNLHPYYQPDQWGYAYDLLEGLLESKGIDKPICVTEIGWPHASDNDPAAFTPEIQRDAIGCKGIGSLVSAGCRKIWVYQDIDDPPGKDYEGLYYGLFDYQGNPMPAWYQFRAWMRTFDLMNQLQPSF